MSELEPRQTGSTVAASGGVIETAVRYTIIITQLAMAGIRLSGLADQMRRTYRYVEGCSASVDRLADQMASLTPAVDRDTVGEHHQAAAVMRAVLGHAEAMSAATEDLAVLFGQASAAHQADYGPVTEAVHSMPVPMAAAEFYSNR